jgi:predicted DNA-binding transcriptional regulator AlpA
MGMSDNDLIDTHEAAAILCLAEQTVRYSRKTGLLCGRDAPAYLNLGPKTVRYRRDVIEKWVADSPQYRNTAQAKLAQIESEAATQCS